MLKSSSDESFFNSSTIEVDITPSIDERSIPLQGLWKDGERIAVKVESSLQMQLLLIEDPKGNRVLWVTADIFAFDPFMLEQIVMLAAPWGIIEDTLVLNASHTHYAPGTLSNIGPGLGRVDESFRNHIIDEIALALPKLVQSLFPATISWAEAEVQIGFNRRLLSKGLIEMRPNVDGCYEKNTPILVVETKNKTCLLVNHGCHPTGIGGAAVISADFVGAFRDVIRNELGKHIVPMFLQGAAGNIKHGRLSEGNATWSKSTSATKAVGHELASQILKVIRAGLNPVKGDISWANKDITLPFSPISSIDDIAAKPEHQRYTAQMVKEWERVLIERHSDGILPKSLTTRIASISIGNIALVHWSAEPVTEWALKIRAECNQFDIVFFAGYTNGLQGYFPIDRMLEEGGYESSRSNFVYLLPSPFQSGIEQQLMDSTMETLKSVQSGRKLMRKMPINSSKKAFFVMSAGRSGTQTLAHLLSPARNAVVWHHPKPDLVKEAQDAYWGGIDIKQSFWHNRSKNIAEAWGFGKIYGETDHYMTPFVPAIADEIAGAKFIILIRDPREFIRSGMRRNYYLTNKLWDTYRLAPKPEDPEYLQFEAYSSFEKVCWLWAQTYQHIMQTIQNISDSRIKVVRFEKLTNGTEEIQSIYDFLELDGYDQQKLEFLLSQKLNAQTKGDFPHPSQWSDELHQCCWKHVGKVASYFGYPKNYNHGKTSIL